MLPTIKLAMYKVLLKLAKVYVNCHVWEERVGMPKGQTEGPGAALHHHTPFLRWDTTIIADTETCLANDTLAVMMLVQNTGKEQEGLNLQSTRPRFLKCPFTQVAMTL